MNDTNEKSINTVILNNIEFNIEQEKNHDNSFYQYICKMIQYMMNNGIDSLDNAQLLELLQKFKHILQELENNTTLLTSLTNKLTNIKNLQNLDSQEFDDFTKEYSSIAAQVNNHRSEFDQFMFDCNDFVKSNFNKSNIAKNGETNTQHVDNEPNSSETTIKKESINTTDTNIQENTLIISEMNGKVILPYTLQDLRNTLQSSSSTFTNLQEIIDTEFTVPYSKYSNPIISRFKEAYNLARNKEKLGVVQSFNLGLELLFNYNLHPAIISACKNIDELDIYLDYLEDGQIDKFKIFDIKFEVAPAVVN